MATKASWVVVTAFPKKYHFFSGDFLIFITELQLASTRKHQMKLVPVWGHCQALEDNPRALLLA